MGGRGVYSYSGNSGEAIDDTSLGKYAVASLNRGTAAGTTTEAAIARFREQLMDKKVEYSAYIDDAGYVHSLGSTNKEGETLVAPLSTVAKEKGVSTVIHNHPHGGKDGQKWGGPFSEDDLVFIADAYSRTGGKVNRMVATAREGTYSAKVRKNVSVEQASAAAKRANRDLKGKRFQSERALWDAVNHAYTSEFAKIGIDITFSPQGKRTGKLITKKLGNYW